MNILRNFVVFEGGDGSGTSTQIELLRNRLNPEQTPEIHRGGKTEPGLRLFATFEPTDSPIGRILRQALRGTLPLKPETVARLFAADRNEHLFGPEGIREHCLAGDLVVSDRYVPSSLVYQGIDCGEALPALLNRDFPLPELLIFFDLDPNIALERLEGRSGRDVYERLDVQLLVRERYRALLPAYAAGEVRLEHLDASRPAEEVAEEVWRILRQMPIFEAWGEES
ncbi:dTMP kinase [Treponema sp. TIM-1]|uniref:dTMP kinase n=1 Tax=Treponema sp. TIM-1 TaxID=2898417 RepID=UPI003980C58A